MIKRPTVIVLGAGSSAPFGFPVGARLRNLILQQTPRDLDEIPNSPNSATVTRGSGEVFLKEFRRSNFGSIDAFLSRRPEFTSIGKHAIARVLLPYESEAQVLDSHPDDNWHRPLLDAMDAPWDSLHENAVAFITFNYDRSLEFALIGTLSARFGRPLAEARHLVGKLKIVHVYGSLGSLEPGRTDHVPFGGGATPAPYLFQAAAGIKVVPEGRDDSPEVQRAQSWLTAAEALCFLGFGFDPTNLRRLGGPSVIGAGGRASGGSTRGLLFAATAVSLTPQEVTDAIGAIAQGPFHHSVRSGMLNMGCLDLIRSTNVIRAAED
ncbi:MAG: hypothetical protein JNL30_01090 [Rubrivivax sp.]|nr:hypothetical protein [Rubrivivax sp.]